MENGVAELLPLRTVRRPDMTDGGRMTFEMMPRRAFGLSAALLLVLPLAALLSCGSGDGGEGPAPASGASGPDTVEIAVVDTIGVMMGDSAYVFGTVTDASYTPAGEIYVLDALRCRLGIYGPEGEHLGFAGRPGSGPGEYDYPRSFALMDDGSVVISDWGGISVTYLTPDLELDTLLVGFPAIAPDRIAPLPDGSFAGMTLRHGVEEGEPTGEAMVAAFDRDVEPFMVFCSHPMRFSTDDDGDLNVHVPGLDWDTGPEGSVWVAMRSDTVWSFTGYGPGGDTLTTVERVWEPVAKTEEELEEGMLHETLSTDREEGASVNRERRNDIQNLNWNAIHSIDVDDLGRVWVGQGWTGTPTLEVYGPAGDLLFVAVVPELAGTRELSYCMDNGMLAFETDPADYPKVYLLELREEPSAEAAAQ